MYCITISMLPLCGEIKITKSGWVNKTIFMGWFEHFVKFYHPKQQSVIADRGWSFQSFEL